MTGHDSFFQKEETPKPDGSKVSELYNMGTMNIGTNFKLLSS